MHFLEQRRNSKNVSVSSQAGMCVSECVSTCVCTCGISEFSIISVPKGFQKVDKVEGKNPVNLGFMLC